MDDEIARRAAQAVLSIEDHERLVTKDFLRAFMSEKPDLADLWIPRNGHVSLTMAAKMPVKTAIAPTFHLISSARSSEISDDERRQAMTEKNNVVLAQLRAIRATLGDHTQRFERIEQRLSVGFMAAYAGTQDEIAQLRSRIERIEARLELSD